VTQNEHEIIATATLFKIISAHLSLIVIFGTACEYERLTASLAQDIMQITKMALWWRRMLLLLRGSPSL
jgi:hypothetical protein